MWQRTVRRKINGCGSTKIEEDMPGYGDTHRCFQKYKKGLAMTSQLSIRINEKYTNKQKHHNYLDGN